MFPLLNIPSLVNEGLGGHSDPVTQKKDREGREKKRQRKSQYTKDPEPELELKIELK